MNKKFCVCFVDTPLVSVTTNTNILQLINLHYTAGPALADGYLVICDVSNQLLLYSVGYNACHRAVVGGYGDDVNASGM